MDETERSPAPAPDQWVTIDEAVEWWRDIHPSQRARSAIKSNLWELVANRSIRARNVPSAQEEALSQRVRSKAPAVPPTELHVGDLRDVLLTERERYGWTVSVDDILRLGTSGFDPSAARLSRLQIAAERNKGGRRIKAALPAAMVEATLKLAHEGSALNADVARWITEAVESRNESISPSQATEYAGIVLRLYKAWQNTGN